MEIAAILFGSIGVLAETSELQRQAFNEAFAEAGHDIEWTEAEYRERLTRPGGSDRIARMARERGLDLRADALHARKSALFRQRIAETGLSLRPGVADVIDAAGDEGVQLAFVSGTDSDTIDAVLGAAGIDPARFAFIATRGTVESAKPDPAIYRAALQHLGVEPAEAVAIEDSPESAAAPVAAGIPTIAFPGAYHRDRDFDGVSQITAKLSAELLGLRQPI